MTSPTEYIFPIALDPEIAEDLVKFEEGTGYWLPRFIQDIQNIKLYYREASRRLYVEDLELTISQIAESRKYQHDMPWDLGGLLQTEPRWKREIGRKGRKYNKSNQSKAPVQPSCAISPDRGTDGRKFRSAKGQHSGHGSIYDIIISADV